MLEACAIFGGTDKSPPFGILLPVIGRVFQIAPFERYPGKVPHPFWDKLGQRLGQVLKPKKNRNREKNPWKLSSKGLLRRGIVTFYSGVRSKTQVFPLCGASGGS